jgi:transcription elongation GreA/GreB family factor
MNLKSDAERMAFKQRITEACCEVIEQRIKNAAAAMEQAQESANSEEKSTAGDKHETSRSMSQIESGMNARQLAQAQRELDALHSLNITTLYKKASPGSVVITHENIFFIGLGLGVIGVDGQEVISISPVAPLAAELLKKKIGDQVNFKGKRTAIKQVF